MKKLLFFTLTIMAFAGSDLLAQNTIFGKWKTIDDDSGEAKSIVEIYEKDGKAFGKVTKIFRADKQDAVCNECDEDDPRKGEKILGMVILKNMEKDGDEWTDGKILDPNSGTEYKCNMWIEDGKLNVRGYVGFSLLGRTQEWERVE